MGALSDRGNRVATFLRAHTGYPHIRFDYRAEGSARGFTMPVPLTLQWLTCRDSRHAITVAQSFQDEKGIGGVAYGFNAENVDDVVVVMPLRAYTQLASTYIETVIMDRERSKE